VRRILHLIARFWPNKRGLSPIQVPYNKALLSDKFSLRSKFAAERGVETVGKPQRLQYHLISRVAKLFGRPRKSI
jgi:hypothetical protein